MDIISANILQYMLKNVNPVTFLKKFLNFPKRKDEVASRLCFCIIHNLCQNGDGVNPVPAGHCGCYGIMIHDSHIMIHVM
ncbi:MAG: hypothetical protein A2206_01935 [Candidatus Magasanikbacteria bacterium RIFOXYA1_FULL_40_8]|uniref:Uncharacterized protein n=1 Tax=Candidatus Magasanikbacteria bacterium RIFOXYA1_FULL_40_8 TaxID=1798694 RepID=A0A1F6NT73_9BACT|nr:MAG: hypothetical protein A2206_01935 [Candidatus Magasanikbacteria bacterium RIFOXYA1_FULL_40_8]